MLKKIYILLMVLCGVMVSCKDEYEDTKNAGDNFLEAIKASGETDGELEGGVMYKRLTPIDEDWTPMPEMPTWMRLNMTVTFINGDTLIDKQNRNLILSAEGDTIQKAESYSYYYSNMISGCKVALRKMKLGEKWRVWIPYNMAYGSDGVDDGEIKVDPYTALVYDIEVVEIRN